MSNSRSRWASVGPGLLFAGAAIGVSHIVQSTRAGAGYGLGLVLVVVLANLLKYPAFRFGPDYAAATGHSLLEGYGRIGAWALWLYGLLTVGTMFTVGAAVTLVTAGLFEATFSVGLGVVGTSAIVLAFAAVISAVGRFKWLERVNRVLVLVLAVTTLTATLAIAGQLKPESIVLLPRGEDWAPGSWLFVAGLIGWMPSAIDLSVWQSLWTLEKIRDREEDPSSDVRFDFHVGYVGTAVFALMFVFMGAAAMHGSHEAFEREPVAFARQVVTLYERALGAWVGPIVGASAFAVMLSTTLTVVDGFPRALVALGSRLRRSESEQAQESASPRAYGAWALVLVLGSLAVIALMRASLRHMVDLATTLSFLTAPVLAWLNDRAMRSVDVPSERRPGGWLAAMSVVGIAVQAAFAVGYLVLRYASS